MAKRSFEECFFHFEADASEMDKIDNTIRLAGLKFPKGKRVIGRKNADLIVALGAYDISRNCTGNQLLVVARLCILYEAILKTYNKQSYLDINDDFFYEQALKDISERYPSIAKFLSTSTLRQAIEIYLLAFHRSGLKPIKPNANKTDAVQDTPHAQSDAAQPNDSGSETFIGQDLMEPSESAEQQSARVKLEKLVKDWMAVRAIARRKQNKTNEPETKALPYPERKPNESNKAYILRLQEECECYFEENQMYEKEGYRETKKHDDLYDDYNELFNHGNQLLEANKELLKANNERHKEKSDMQDMYIAKVHRLLDKVDEMQDMIKEENDENDLMQDIIDKQRDQIDELKRRLGVDGHS
ncbi:hypothetical protein LA080_003055 [Diaporthe eres]|uniref:Uncharacterized protein n=1 Tax=Diaporthe vaccinii TaxID=105482 RepID=A0ABR4EU73_9PEZI|nr:hypothetical protein LA080_003055 [Diaporthe eres]